jgi:hypothetical protein
MRQVRGIEVRHSLTADATSQNILVGVYKSVDTIITQFIDEFLDFIEIGIVVDSWSSLDGFPHDTQAHEVESP